MPVLFFFFFCHIRCFRDSKLTGDKSFFLQRSQEDKLQFQLKAFRFPQSINNSVRTRQKVWKGLIPVLDLNPEQVREKSVNMDATFYITEAKNGPIKSHKLNFVSVCFEASFAI